MWTVVHFISDNTVEVVPNHWAKKDSCAWPNKDVKKHIHQRTMSNNFDFSFIPSRILKKDIDGFLKARSIAKKAENTSDLSTCEEIQTQSRGKKIIVQDAPIYNGPYTEKNTSSMSVHDTKKLIISKDQSLNHLPVKAKRRLFESSSSQEYFQSDKKNIGFKRGNNSVDGKTYSNFMNIDKRTTQHDQLSDDTTSDELVDVLEQNQSKNEENLGSVNILNSSHDLSILNEDTQRVSSKSAVVYTTSSPFKVTNYNGLIQHQSIPLNEPMKHMNPSVDNSETLKKILNVVMKIKYDVENISHNQSRMDDILTDTVLSIRSRDHCQEDSTIHEANDYSLMLPLHNEEELIDFEMKLLNKPFRLNVVNGLKRLVKKSLASTIRQMLRTLFEDTLLQTFSYVGQKKKKIFSSLASCAVIFESIRKIKNFQDVSNADIEMPIKIYIAGAAFRKKK